MLLRRAFFGLAGVCFGLAAQEGPANPVPPDQSREPNDPTKVRLPSGELQSDAIAKADYQSTLDDAHKLAKLADDLSAEIEKEDRYVVSISVIHKTEEIEKLAKRIRTRLKRY